MRDKIYIIRRTGHEAFRAKSVKYETNHGIVATSETTNLHLQIKCKLVSVTNSPYNNRVVTKATFRNEYDNVITVDVM